MSSFDATSLGLWFDKPATINESEPSSKISIPNRQEVVYPGQQTTIPIPREHGFLSNGHIVFDVNMTFPYQLAPVANSGGGMLSFDTFIVNDAFVAPYDRLLPYDIATIMASDFIQDIIAHCPAGDNIDSFASIASTLGYGVPDYALDPPRNYGHLVHLDRIVLEQSNGNIIYERSAATSWDGIITLALATTSGPEFFAMDLMMGTGIAQNAPGIDPFLVPPPYVRGTRRANSFVISPDRTSITFTKEVNMPLPLPGLKNMPVQFMSDGDLNVQLTFATTAAQNMVAETNFFTGKLNFFQDSELAYSGSCTPFVTPPDLNISDGFITGQQTAFAADEEGDSTFPLICNSFILPVIPNFPAGPNFPSLPKRPDGALSSLCVAINGVFLDTSDLSDILGDPTLIDIHGYPSTSGVATNDNPSFPTCSILNNGLLLMYKLSKMDIPAASASLDFQPDTMLHTCPDPSTAENEYDLMYGHTVKRDMWCSLQVHASQIASITLRHRHVIAPTSAYSALTDIIQGITLDDNQLGSKGQVFVQFASPILLKVPLYGANLCSGVSTNKTYNGNNIAYNRSYRTCFHNDNIVDGLANTINVGLFALNWELDLVVSTNAWGCFGSQLGPQIPVIPKELAYNTTSYVADPAHNRFDDPISGAAMYSNKYARPYNVNLPVPTFPVYIQPSTITYSNLRLTFDKPLLDPKYISGMSEMYNDPETGLPFTFVEMTSLKFPMLQQGYITLQTSPRQVFFLRLGLRCSISPNPFGLRPYVPVTNFSNYELTQGGVQVKVADPAWAAQVLGNCWPVQRTNLNGGTTGNSCIVQPTGFLKGSGGNAYFQEQIEISIGNCFARSDLSTGEPSFPVNMSYLNMVRGAWDIWYSMNTHGGAAEIPVFTQWQLRYTVTNNMEYKMVYPVQILRNLDPATPYYNAVDPLGAVGYNASQTYAVAVPDGVNNLGYLGYPQDLNSTWSYSHYLQEMAGFYGEAGTATEFGNPAYGYNCNIPDGSGQILPPVGAGFGKVYYGFQYFKQWDDNVLFNQAQPVPFLLEVQIYHRRRITFYKGKAAATGADIGLFVSTN